jgi:hypothetical protein
MRRNQRKAVYGFDQSDYTGIAEDTRKKGWAGGAAVAQVHEGEGGGRTGKIGGGLPGGSVAVRKIRGLSGSESGLDPEEMRGF